MAVKRVPLPAGPPGWKEGLFWAAGLLNVEAGTALPFLGDAADLENVFAAGEVCTAGVVLSTASLGNRCKCFHINHNTHRCIFVHTYAVFVYLPFSENTPAA